MKFKKIILSLWLLSSSSSVFAMEPKTSILLTKKYLQECYGLHDNMTEQELCFLQINFLGAGSPINNFIKVTYEPLNNPYFDEITQESESSQEQKQIMYLFSNELQKKYAKPAMKKKKAPRINFSSNDYEYRRPLYGSHQFKDDDLYVPELEEKPGLRELSVQSQYHENFSDDENENISEDQNYSSHAETNENDWDEELKNLKFYPSGEYAG